MVQDDVQREPHTEEADERDGRRRSRVWPGILILIVILVVLLLLWLSWRQRTDVSPLTVKKPTETTVDAPGDRPDPTIPSVIATGTTDDAPRVPDVVGESKSAAEGVLASAGYTVTSSTVYSASKAPGIVVAQNPGGGTALDQGETVAIVVSVGTPTTGDVTMPEIVGLTQASAESKVKAAGLVPYLMYGRAGIEEGRVISQWPEAGESVPAGSEGFIQVQLNN